ncbi:MAG TPA: peptidoglycan bridge formation glycyltransferase FemA/FemB family protein [Desulfosalsimonadaceae bacterium]|nr:peptidoglycan bridge formation glycyltransferase FemA/FemB family protein [Desulfosalsimonadaceae bacterium]
MELAVRPKHTSQIEPGCYLQQTAFWGRVKKHQGRRAQAFGIMTENHERQSPAADSRSPAARRDLLVVIRRLGANAEMAYVPFGPEFLPEEEHRGPWLEKLSERLRPHLPENCICIRYDLPWQSPWAADKHRYTRDHIWMGKPRTGIREMRMNFDTRHWNLRKAPTDLLPTDTVILDLQTDKNRLLSRMKPKTRYNIRLSAKRGVRVREAGLRDLPAWYAIYCETAERHGMMLNDMDYFRPALEVSAADCASPARIHLLLAELGGKPVAGIMLAISGKRATYLYGASSARQGNSMATYALQWAAIEKARDAGCSDYDLFGTAPYPDPHHTMYGLYRFKTGFGGRMMHRQGCWDYPFDEEQYALYRASEMAGPAFAE